MRRLSILVIALLMLISQASISFAASKQDSIYFAPYGSVPELGLIVAWGVDLKLTVYYTNILPRSSRIDDAYIVASMTPKQSSAAGNGSVGGVLKEKADTSSYSSRPLSSLPGRDIIHDPNTHIFFSHVWHSLRVFDSSATIQVPVTYTNRNAILLFNNEGTATVTINR